MWSDSRALPLFSFIGLALTAIGCGSSTTTNVMAPSNLSRCQPTVQGSPTTFGPSGGTGTVSIGLSRECSWSAASTASWIEITSGREGQGDGSVAYRVMPNSDPVLRRGSINVAEGRVDVSQEAAPCSFQVSRPTDSVGSNGGQIRIEIGSHPECRWTASSQASWITLAPASGTGPGAVQIAVAANPGAARTAIVVIAGQSLQFTQAAREADPPPAPNPPPAPPTPPQPPGQPQCTFSVSPGDRDFSFAGGTGSFSLATGSGCSWTATSSATWLTITSQSAGSGGGQVRYFVLPNVSSSSRQASIVIGTAAHRVTQSGVSGDDDDDDDDDVRIRGPVASLSGQCPAVQFSVNGSTVVTSNQTDFSRGNCSHLVNGLEVEVEGRRGSNGRIIAAKVTLFRE